MNTRPELLIHPTIPTELEYLSPKKNITWWNKERKAVETHTKGLCQACGVHKESAWYRKYLEAHEICTLDNEKGLLILNEVVVLCHSCHQFIHIGKLVRDFEEGVIGESYLKNVLQHGVSLISSGKGLKPTTVQAIHWLIHFQDFSKSDAIEYVVKQKMVNIKQYPNMDIEWKLEYGNDIHIPV